MDSIEPVDMVVIALLAVASVRGFLIGLVRESFSLGGIAAAFLSVKIFANPAATWLVEVSDGGITPPVAPFVAGLGLVVFTIGSITTVGRVVRRGVRVVGLGLADRLGGALLGGAEGALVIGILLSLAGETIGFNHSSLSNTRSVATFERLQILVNDQAQAIDVAAPPQKF